MSMNTYVFSKDAEDLATSFDLTLNPAETVLSILTGSPTPTDFTPVAVFATGAGATVNLHITGGAEGVTYGVPLTVTTDQRVFVVMVAVAVASASFAPQPSADPGSYQMLVGEIEAGKTAVSNAVFQFGTDFDPSGGYVVWDLMDDQGTIYSSGNAFEYRIVSNGVANVVFARSLVTVPSSVPPSLDNPYQLRYKLEVNGITAYQYENITVFGMPDFQLGTVDAIEMQGDRATLAIATERIYENYVLEIYQGSSQLASMPIPNPERISNGYYVAGAFDTTPLKASLVPYNVNWKFWSNPNQVFRESASLWIVNPSIIQAIEDVKSKINKARQTIYQTPDSQYPSTEVLKWLRRGMDAFNGAYGLFTSFTMTNAMGPVREMWLVQAEIAALQAQYMLEGEKAFQFQGAAISLDVDRTAAIDGMISKLQAQLDNELKAFKQNLIIKGNTSGDGSGDGSGNFNKTQRGAMGSVGILITPASLYGGFLPVIPR